MTFNTDTIYSICTGLILFSVQVSAKLEVYAIKSGPYAQWHKGLPAEIRVGTIALNIEDQRVVFAGKLDSDTAGRIEIEKSRRMVVQENVEEDTNYVVACKVPSRELFSSGSLTCVAYLPRQ